MDRPVTQLTPEQIELVDRAVEKTLFSLGLNVETTKDIEEVRADFAHLRRWRESVDQLQRKSMLTIIGTLITGAIGTFLLGLYQAFKGGTPP